MLPPTGERFPAVRHFLHLVPQLAQGSRKQKTGKAVIIGYKNIHEIGKVKR